MRTEVLDYIDVKERCVELGCNIPTGLALLPINFDTASSKDELVHEDTASTIRKLWRKGGINETKIEKESEKIPYEQRKSLELAIPAVFVSWSLLSQDPNLVSIALNIISNYATDFFKGIVGEKKVKIDIVVEQNDNHKSKLIHYEGDVEGLSKLPQVIKELKEL
jgi:hypothetical protein